MRDKIYSYHYHHQQQILWTGHCDLFQFRINSEIMNWFNIRWDSFDWGSAQRNAFTYIRQHNTEIEQTSMP
jgi:hypothetical protein